MQIMGMKRVFTISSCLFMFIASSISDDYLASNPTHHLGSVLLWVFRRVLLLFAQIFSQGRVSLLFTVILMGIAYTFTDSSNLKWRTHLAWSMLHALCQISSALICILFVEFMAEFVVSEGLVATAGKTDGVTTTQSCGTGLANTIYDEYTIHFSHTLEDFQLLNTTNSTDRPPDLLESCRFGVLSLAYHLGKVSNDRNRLSLLKHGKGFLALIFQFSTVYSECRLRSSR